MVWISLRGETRMNAREIAGTEKLAALCGNRQVHRARFAIPNPRRQCFPNFAGSADQVFKVTSYEWWFEPARDDSSDRPVRDDFQFVIRIN